MQKMPKTEQKRHLLLAYIRTHPEELAPYEWEQ